ncbi:MAG: BrnT family toxin [Methylococcales bacterium]|nr:BrnT family toxin [Methylococcales bacterium]
MNEINFEFDPTKATRNEAKHGVSFGLAVRVFFDPCRIESHDPSEEYGEDRWATIGMVNHAVLYVVYTVRDGDTIRLISARKANEKERKQYYQAHA